MARALKVAVQMDPIETINIDADSTFALMLEAQRRGHTLSALRGPPPCPPRRRQAPGRTPRGLPLRPRPPLTVERKRGAHYVFGDLAELNLATMDVILMLPGSALRHGLHHRQPPAGAHPSEHPGGERPRRRAQCAGETAGHPLPRPHAPHHDHLGTWKPSEPSAANTRTSSSSRSMATAAPACSASSRTTRTQPRRAAGNVLRSLARAADVPAP